MDRYAMTAVRMYWDSGFSSWSAFGVVSQPTLLLVDANGKIVKRWSGELDSKAVDAALTKLRLVVR